jgi:hypothetical protein
MILRYPSKRDLSHQLASKADLGVGIGRGGERLESCVATASTPCIFSNMARIDAESSRLTLTAGRPDDLVLACRERLGDLDADGAGSSDNDNFRRSIVTFRIGHRK